MSVVTVADGDLDLYERALQAERDQQEATTQAQGRELQRLRYEVQLAQRQYGKVDPDNRLVAGELERRWETALRTLRDTEERVAREQQTCAVARIPQVAPAIRAAFVDLGTALPTLWQSETLTRPHRKALLRCLIDKVILERRLRDRVQTRIVWHGGAVSDLEIPLPVHATHNLADFAALEAEALALEAEGKSDAEIARLLTARGFRSALRETVLPSTIRAIRLRHQRIHRYRGPRPRRVAGALTISQLAQQLDVDPKWIYREIDRGVIAVDRDTETGLYLFPDHPETLSQLRELRAGTRTQVSLPRGYPDA